MKRSDRGLYGGRESTQATKEKGWPLCHLYQMIGAAFIFLMIILCSTDIIPGGQKCSVQMNHLIDQKLPVEEWLRQWKITWEEWMNGSNDSR